MKRLLKTLMILFLILCVFGCTKQCTKKNNVQNKNWKLNAQDIVRVDFLQDTSEAYTNSAGKLSFGIPCLKGFSITNRTTIELLVLAFNSPSDDVPDNTSSFPIPLDPFFISSNNTIVARCYCWGNFCVNAWYGGTIDSGYIHEAWDQSFSMHNSNFVKSVTELIKKRNPDIYNYYNEKWIKRYGKGLGSLIGEDPPPPKTEEEKHYEGIMNISDIYSRSSSQPKQTNNPTGGVE